MKMLASRVSCPRRIVEAHKSHLASLNPSSIIQRTEIRVFRRADGGSILLFFRFRGVGA
jgi:hypothetical protein